MSAVISKLAYLAKREIDGVIKSGSCVAAPSQQDDEFGRFFELFLCLVELFHKLQSLTNHCSTIICSVRMPKFIKPNSKIHTKHSGNSVKCLDKKADT